MREQIFEYLIAQDDITPKIAASICDKMEKHTDIMTEFSEFIKTGEFPTEGAISVGGYTAKLLAETTYLKPVGAYNYLIFLRNRPTEALAQLKKGLPRK